MVNTRFEKALALFDTYNLQDPNTITWDGVTYPYAYFYALQLHDWVKKLAPLASEALLLASRSQHIGRWQIPREQYPKTKAGYLNWRTDLAKFHAAKAGELMQEAGYNDDEIKAVQRIIRKENIRTDEEVQVMENALCLVFLQFQYEDFIEQHDKEKVIRILQKSWRKMSEPGREAALALPFGDKGKALVEEALSK
ncbi:MAG: DUF4202 domain-containing protein [Flavisolibacter sp.]|nr:DUF4202 domain-containing protein [Flavisolibacter sp.]